MMRESISVIKWCGLICIVFLVLTYAVTVNSEGNFITVDSVWISNSFLITDSVHRCLKKDQCEWVYGCKMCQI